MSGLQCIARPSPNHGPRKLDAVPELVVLHYTAMDTREDALARLCDPQAEVSCHYLISGDGTLFRLVPEDRRAWHAGAGSWAGQGDVNSRSIGIELDNRGTHPFSEPLMARLETLLRDILSRRALPPSAVIGHSDMAPGRKGDPGPHFDWARLARQGLAAAPGTATPDRVDEASFTACAQAAGFTVDVGFDDLLASTRLRFAPWRRGPLQAADYCLGGA